MEARQYTCCSSLKGNDNDNTFIELYTRSYIYLLHNTFIDIYLFMAQIEIVITISCYSYQNVVTGQDRVIGQGAKLLPLHSTHMYTYTVHTCTPPK